MNHFKPIQKLILITRLCEIIRVQVVGIKPDHVFLMPLGARWQPLRNGKRLIRLTKSDIENNEFTIIKKTS